MKKIFALMLALFMIFTGLAACKKATPATTTTKPASVTKPSAPVLDGSTTVSAEQWAAAFADDFRNVTMKFYDEKYVDANGQEQWVVIDHWFDGEWMRYYWSVEDESEDVIIINVKLADMNDRFCSETVMEYVGVFADDYAAFQYDEETASYTNADNSVRVRFEDSKLVQIITFEGTADEERMVFYDYGITDVNPPAM